APPPSRRRRRSTVHRVDPSAMTVWSWRITLVPAGEVPDLGGDHLMLMELAKPLEPGADVSLTVTFEDGSTMAITAQIRDFA
ncbi:hypothetical protein C6A85_15035, partial [Mycobacterium sp. ITM-2017-0098]